MTRLRVAVVGAGHLGRIHAGLVQKLPQAELVAIVDPDPQARSDAARTCQVRCVPRVRQILGQVDAAIVAAPTTAHCELGRILLAHNIHVFMEKPLAASLAEARTLAALAERTGRVLQVGHIERFNPALRAAAPRLKQPRYIEARRLSGYTARATDVGAVLDLMVHDLDLVLQLAGSSVRRVHAWGQTVLGPWEDLAQARIEFHNGCVANLIASRVANACERSMSVYCPSVHAQIDFHRRTVELVHLTDAPALASPDGGDRHAAPAPSGDGPPAPHRLRREQLAIPESNPLLEELQEFLAAIHAGRPPAVTAEDGCAAVELAERVRAAFATPPPSAARHPAHSQGAHDPPCILTGPFPSAASDTPPRRLAG